VDADILDKLIDKGIEKAPALNEDEQKVLTELYTQAKGERPHEVELAQGNELDAPVTAVRPEHMRRLYEMSKAGGMGGSFAFPEQVKLVVNTEHPLARKLLLMPEGPEREAVARKALELALLGQGLLEGKELQAFLQRSFGEL
jgi:molecular chaperone HtpG